MKIAIIRFSVVSLLFCSKLTLWSAAAQAGVGGVAIRETVEYMTKKFGKEAAETGVETMTKKLETLTARYGDEALVAARKVGPQALKLADDAGELGGKSLYYMSRYGDDALRIVRNPQALKLAAGVGDDAAEAMIKHGPEMTTALIGKYGDDGARALAKLSRGEAIELATKQADNTLAAMPAPEKLLGVIATHGDRAMAFTTKHWKVLLGAAAFTAFVSDPVPYLDGVKNLADVGLSNTVKPLIDGVTGGADWTIVLGLAIAALVGLFAFRTWLGRKKLQTG